MAGIRDTRRREARRARAALDGDERAVASERICRHIERDSLFHAAQRLGLYFALPEEVDVSALIASAFDAGKKVFVPIVLDDERMHFVRLTPDTTLSRNRYGIWEPVNTIEPTAPGRLDLVVTPLVAFDETGNRLGMGAGYYDMCFRSLRLRQRWLHPKLLGAAFDCQQVPSITAAPWDIPLFAVATEKGVRRFPRNRGDSE